MQCFEVWQNNHRIAYPVLIADTFGTRFRGLMLRKSLRPGEGLLLKHCSSIHCCFMRFPIDVVYLTEDYSVCGVETVAPWHLGGHFPGAKHVLELESGHGSLLVSGTKIEIMESNYDE